MVITACSKFKIVVTINIVVIINIVILGDNKIKV